MTCFPLSDPPVTSEEEAVAMSYPKKLISSELLKKNFKQHFPLVPFDLSHLVKGFLVENKKNYFFCFPHSRLVSSDD